MMSTYEQVSSPTVERAITLQLLRDDHAGLWSRADLESELSDIAPLALSDALEALKAVGALTVDGEHVQASRCARHLDALELVGI